MNKEGKLRQLHIELFKQTEGFCGPASLKMVLAYYGTEKTEDELADLMGATREYGCDPIDITITNGGQIIIYRNNINDLDKL